MTRAQTLRARRRAHHYDTPAQILHELHRIGSRWLWPALGQPIDGVAHLMRLASAREAWREHERLARRVLLDDGCASAALWDLGRGLLVRAAQIARQARGGAS